MLHVTYWVYLGKESFSSTTLYITEEQRVLADDKR